MNDLSISYNGLHPVTSYRFEAISDIAAFEALRPEWDRLLALDPDAGIFLSHQWLAPALRGNPGEWRVFVVRDQKGAVTCIYPTKYRVHWSTSRTQFQTEIEAAGRLAWGEETGFICDPAQEEASLRALAERVAACPWKSLDLRYEPTGRRAAIFAKALGDGFAHRFPEYRINDGSVNNLAALSVPLNNGFEQLLTTRISAKTRQKIRRQRRRFLDSGKYRITTATKDTIETDIGGLLRNWVGQWGPQKGENIAMQMAEAYARALLTADSLGRLYLPVLWKGDVMLGALGHVLDPQQKCVHFLVAGRNSEVKEAAIGLLLHAHAIEWSAEQGYDRYLFGHGDQAYKQNFGPAINRLYYLAVRRHGGDNVLDQISLKPALRRLSQFATDGRRKEVERGAAQLAGLL